MSNPLMSVMMNNTLKKQGIDPERAFIEGEAANLNKKQQELLLDCLQKKSNSPIPKEARAISPSSIKLTTLDELKPSIKKEKHGPIENTIKKAERPLVTLASIGKRAGSRP